MKHVYYVVDSTIFNNDEDMFKALAKGAKIVNDDADLEFTTAARDCGVYIVATDKFSGRSVQSRIGLVRADIVADTMDRLVEARIKSGEQFFDLF